MKFEDQRKIMVEKQLIARGIKDPLILNAFMKVPRELFVPDEAIGYAYGDHPAAIGKGQTISQPYIVALMLELLELKKDDTVLDIGTGSGYQTAILAELVNEVFTIERIESLSKKAKSVLKKIGYTNIHFLVGDGTLGWQKAFPPKEKFEKIIVSASSPKVPTALINQLNDKGRLIIPCGNRFQQELILIQKNGDEVTRSNYGFCAFVPLIGDEGWQG